MVGKMFLNLIKEIMMQNVRPLKEEYIAVAKVLKGDLYLKLDEQQFIDIVFRYSDGSVDRKKLKQLYYSLLREAR